MGFQIALFIRTFTFENRENVYLTVKEFDLLYFLFLSPRAGIYKRATLWKCMGLWSYNRLYKDFIYTQDKEKDRAFSR